jgi:hypothetical protein
VSIRQCASSKDKSLAKDIFHRIWEYKQK